MIFEYNGNLNFNERVEKVTNEIITMYPNIEKSKAKMASIMEEPINKHLTYRNIYNRYYNIMLANINDFVILNAVGTIVIFLTLFSI